MDTLLYVVTSGNGLLRRIGEQILEQQRRRFSEALERSTRSTTREDDEDERAESCPVDPVATLGRL